MLDVGLEDISDRGSVYSDSREAKAIAPDSEVDQTGLLYFCSRSEAKLEDRVDSIRLVLPDLLQKDFLHHYHASLTGGHQGTGSTYLSIRKIFHWRGMYRSVQRYLGDCVDCETSKERPYDRGGSPTDIQATSPFQILAMNHIPSFLCYLFRHGAVVIVRSVLRLCDCEI